MGVDDGGIGIDVGVCSDGEIGGDGGIFDVDVLAGDECVFESVDALWAVGLKLYGGDVFAASDGGGDFEYDGVVVVVGEVGIDRVLNIDVDGCVADPEIGDKGALDGRVTPGVIGGELK